MKKIFFAAYGGGHVSTIIPVIKFLFQNYNGKFELSILGINLAAEILHKNQIPSRTLSHYIDDFKFINIGYEFAKTNHNFSSSVSFLDSIAYYGFSYYDLLSKVGDDVAKKIFRIFDRRLFLPVNSCKSILAKEKPDLVIVTSMQRFESSFIIAANQLQIKSIRIEDVLGMIHLPFPDKIQVDNLKEKNDLIAMGIKEREIILKSELLDSNINDYYKFVSDSNFKINPTYFTVINEFAKQNIIKRGVDPNKIIITGNPILDSLKITKSTNIINEIHHLRQDSAVKIITFMSQPLPSREKTLRKIINLFKKQKNFKLVIKLHPNEDGIIHTNIVKELEYDALIIKNYDAPDVIKNSDLIITISSTTAIESAYLLVPVISVLLNGEEDFLGLEKMGLGRTVYNEINLMQSINEVFNDETSYSSIKNNQLKFSMQDKSTENVVKLINFVLSQ